MLEWKISNQHEKLQKVVINVKNTFDSWFSGYWSKTVTKERMLSENSPIPRAYYLMCKSEDETLEKFPNEGKETCSSCNKMTDKWIETEFSFCDEYGCGMVLCKDCAKELKDKINEFLNEREN